MIAMKNGNGSTSPYTIVLVKKDDQDKNRGPDDIKAELLIVSSNSILKTHAMSRCNLSSIQMQKYGQELIKKGLLEVTGNNRRTLFSTTERGKEWLKKLQELRAIENGFNISEAN